MSAFCSSCGREIEPHDSGLCDSCEQQDRYDRASADVHLDLSLADARSIAEALKFLAGIDEGENTDYDNLLRLARLVHDAIPAEAST